jgi:hypothetical protein
MSPATVAILVLAAIAGAAAYFALFLAFESIERGAADRFDSRTVSGFVALVLAGSVSQLATAGVA